MSRWCSAEIELRVITLSMKIESMMANDLTKGEHVDGEEETFTHSSPFMVTMCVLLVRYFRLLLRKGTLKISLKLLRAPVAAVKLLPGRGPGTWGQC